MRLLLVVLLTVAVLMPISGSPVAGESLVLDADGNPVRVLQGPYGDFFPLGGDAPPQASVLVLENRFRPGSATYQLVPGTEGPDVESFVSLIYERGSRSLFVLWESRLGAASSLNLTQKRSDGSWSEAIEITDRLASEQSPPRLALTQDTYTEEIAGDEGVSYATHERTVIHVLWTEKRGAFRETLYTALILENDSYIGSNSIVSLNELFADDPRAGAEPSPALLESATVALGSDSHTVILGFVDASSRQLITVEVSLLPRELSSLADDARAHIILIGAREPELRALAGDARAHIILIGHRIHPRVREMIADRASQAILASGKEGSLSVPDIEELADLARQEVLLAGMEIGESGLLDLGSDDEVVLDMRPIAGAGTAETDAVASHVMQVRSMARFGTPETGGASKLFLSRDGQRVLIAWRQDRDRLQYRESTFEGWTEVRTLLLNDGLDLAEAYELLERRVR